MTNNSHCKSLQYHFDILPLSHLTDEVHVNEQLKVISCIISVTENFYKNSNSLTNVTLKTEMTAV